MRWCNLYLDEAEISDWLLIHSSLLGPGLHEWGVVYYYLFIYFFF